MGIILNIESSTTNCSVSLANDGKCIEFKEMNEGFSHAENLMVFVSEIISNQGLKMNQINAIGVGDGPGSYTGLRIGISAAKGLCFGLDVPLIVVDSLSIMTKQLLESNRYKSNSLFIPMIDARRMEVYTTVQDAKLNRLEEISAKIIDNNSFNNLLSHENVYFFGDGAAKCIDIFKERSNFTYVPNIFPSSKYMSELSYKKFKEKKFEDVAYFEPNYLKEFYTNAKPIQ